MCWPAGSSFPPRINLPRPPWAANFIPPRWADACRPLGIGRGVRPADVGHRVAHTILSCSLALRVRPVGAVDVQPPLQALHAHRRALRAFDSDYKDATPAVAFGLGGIARILDETHKLAIGDRRFVDPKGGNRYHPAGPFVIVSKALIAVGAHAITATRRRTSRWYSGAFAQARYVGGQVAT